MGENNTVLSRLFTQQVFQSLISPTTPHPEIMCRIVRKYRIPVTDKCSNEEVISEIYQYIGKSYRNEYYYKNTLLNKLIINVHRVRTTVALTEVPIAKSKADFIMINGKAVVYEIKTELDSFDRLESQINDYYKAFDHVCVVTSESQAERLYERLQNSPVGIYVLTERNTIHHLKEPSEYRDALEPLCIFKILNKPEYESIVMQINGSLPSATPVHYYNACKEIITQHPITELYSMFLHELKKRNRIDIIDYSNIPEALHFLIYFSKHRQHDRENLEHFLTHIFEGG